MTRKIPIEYENPIDNYLISVCDKYINKCKKNNVTPNKITLFRLLLSIIILQIIYTTNYVLLPVTGFYFCYFLDCMDGHLARTTQTVTIFGDILDHFSDFFMFGNVILILSIKEYNYKKYIISFIFLLLFLTSVHIGLQQKYYKQNYKEIEERPPETLDLLMLMYNIDLNNIKWTRFFGLGTFTLFTGFAIIYMQYNII